MSLPGISCGIAYKGGGSNTVVLNTGTVSSNGEDVAVSWKCDTDTYIYTSKNAVYSQRYQWTPDNPANYEIRATLVSGAVGSGTTGSWLAMTADREWVVSASDTLAVLTMEIRDVATSTVRASCSVTLINWVL